MFRFGRTSDGQVIRQVLAGDRAAFRILVDRYAGMVQGVAYAHLGNYADAEDVSQDTFLRTFESLGRLRDTTHLGGWLTTVARNRCRDLLRKRRREARATESAQDLADEAGAKPDQEEIHRLVRQHLDAMDEDAREVLVLHYFMRKKTREIAAAFGISRSAAAKRLQRARDALGRRLVDALGAELEQKERPKTNTERIMGLVAAASSPWQSAPTASATAEATVAAVATAGASLGAKLLGLISAVVIAALALFMFWPKPERPSLSEWDYAKLAQDAAETAAEAGAPDTSRQAEEETASPEPPTAAQETADIVYEAEAGVVRGRVVDEDGAPAADAVVTLERRFTSFDVPAKPDPLKPYKTTTTSDEAGRFLFEKAPILLRRPPLKSLYAFRIAAQKDGLIAQIEEFDFDSPDVFIELALYEPGLIAGVVVDEKGQPLPDAEVWAICRMGQPRGARSQTIRDSKRAETDDNGRFRIDWLKPGQYLLAASAEGYPPQEKLAWIHTATKNLRFKLGLPCSIRGKVIEDRTDKPLPGIEVAAQGDWMDCFIPRSALTDDSGAFVFADLAPSGYNVSLDRGAFVLTHEPIRLRLESGETTSELRLVAVQGGAVTGRVYERYTKEGLARQTIQASAEGRTDSPSWWVQTDAEGYYRLEGLPSGTFAVGLARHSRKPSYYGDLSIVEILAGRIYEGVDIEAHSGIPITGTVEDAAGNPLAEAFVAAWQKDASSLLSAVTRDDGSFELNYAEPVGGLFFQARHGTGVSATQGPYNVAEDGLHGIVVTVREAGDIQGRVVNANRKPVPWASVSAEPRSDASRFVARPSKPALDPAVYQGGRLETVTPASGNFYLGPLAPDTYTLTARIDGRAGESASQPVVVDVAPGDAVQGVRLVVGRLPGGAIEGAVRLAGNPLVGDQISINQHDAISERLDFYTQSDEAGCYRFEGVPPGTAGLCATHSALDSDTRRVRQLTRANVSVEDGLTTTVDFDFPPDDGGIEGYVSINGQPAAGMEVGAWSEGGGRGAEHVWMDTDAAGYYQTTALSPGTYTVVMRKYDEKGKREIERHAEVEVISGRIVRVDFAVGYGIIEVALTGGAESDQAGIFVLSGEIPLGNASWDDLRELLPGAVCGTERRGNDEDVFRTGGLDPGLYTVVAVAMSLNAQNETEAMESLRHASALAEVATDKITRVELMLP